MMHSFKFIQPADRALGCTVLLDEKPLNCESFTLSVDTGQITRLTVTIPVISSEIDIAALDVKKQSRRPRNARKN